MAPNANIGGSDRVSSLREPVAPNPDTGGLQCYEYSAGAEIARSTRKGRFVMIGVAIGTVLELTGVESRIVGYLSLLGVFIPPLGREC